MAVPSPISTVVRSQSAGSTLGPISITVAAGDAIVVYASCYRATTGGELMNLPTAAGMTFEIITDGTTQARQLKATDSGGGTGRVGHYAWIARNVTAGAKSITLNFVNSSANVAAGFAFAVPRVPASGTYCSRVVNAVYGINVTSVVASISTNLSQARNTVVAVASGIGTNLWNGSASGDGVQPSGWSMLRGVTENFTGGNVDGPPFQAGYIDTNSVAPLSATWTVADDTLDEGFVTTIFALLDVEGGNYVEILLEPASGAGITINGSTGWTVEVSAGDPKDGAQVFSNVAARATGNEIRVPAPAGTTAGQTVNVIVYNATLAHSGGTGVGSTRITGTVRAAA